MPEKLDSKTLIPSFSLCTG